MYYLDIILLLNGIMDAFLLIFTNRLLNKKTKGFPLFLAVLLGSLPVLAALLEQPRLLILSKIVVPWVMVFIACETHTLIEFAKGMFYFSLAAAMTGGIYFMLAGWIGLEVLNGLAPFWLLPITAVVLWGGYQMWLKTQRRQLRVEELLYEVEIVVDGDNRIQVKAKLDTGNELRDPFTDAPVMLLEQDLIMKILPRKLAEFLSGSWGESKNPWSLIWSQEDPSIQQLVFISATGITGQIWLPGIRFRGVKVRQGLREWEQGVTIALVPASLSSENQYQALLHPEQITFHVSKEEIAS